MPSPISHENLTAMSIAEVVSYLDGCEPDDALMTALRADPRAGVRALAAKIERRRARDANERARLDRLHEMEKAFAAKGYTAIAGVDEAGRGPLAGPVVAAAAVLPADFDLPGLDDSKKLTAAKRETLYGLITGQAIAWGVGMAEHDEIDADGILVAAMGAMRTAVAGLEVKPDLVLVDGNQSPGMPCEERLIVNGDGRCSAIAAASVIAKVTRDRIMVEMDERYPGYGFAGHKGYGAETHIAAIREMGPCDIHRFSFRIVPAAAPAGASVFVLERRIRQAQTLDALERAAAGIRRIRDYLGENEVAHLRECWREAHAQFSGGSR